MDKSLEAQLQRLRREFDASFTHQPPVAVERGESFVRLRCAGVKFAVALREISLLQGNIRIVRLPSTNQKLLGICCVRGELLAVFGLAACLGLTEREKVGAWIIRAQGTTTAFAFDHCDGQVKGAVQTTAAAERVVMCEGEPVPLLPLFDLVARVRAESSVPGKEVLNA